MRTLKSSELEYVSGGWLSHVPQDPFVMRRNGSGAWSYAGNGNNPPPGPEEQDDSVGEDEEELRLPPVSVPGSEYGSSILACGEPWLLGGTWYVNCINTNGMVEQLMLGTDGNEPKWMPM